MAVDATLHTRALAATWWKLEMLTSNNSVMLSERHAALVQGHTAFSHEQKFINRTTDNLVKCLIVEPNFKTIGHAD